MLTLQWEWHLIGVLGEPEVVEYKSCHSTANRRLSYCPLRSARDTHYRHHTLVMWCVDKRVRMLGLHGVCMCICMCNVLYFPYIVGCNQTPHNTYTHAHVHLHHSHNDTNHTHTHYTITHAPRTHSPLVLCTSVLSLKTLSPLHLTDLQQSINKTCKCVLALQ